MGRIFDNINRFLAALLGCLTDALCIIKPIDVLDSFIDKSCKYEPLMGDMVYPNEYLKSQGIDKGDRIYFTPDSEYEFTVDGETLYRVFDHQVTMKA